MDEPTEAEESETIAKIPRHIDGISQRVSQIFFLKLDFSQVHKEKKGGLHVRFKTLFQ